MQNNYQNKSQGGENYYEDDDYDNIFCRHPWQGQVLDKLS